MKLFYQVLIGCLSLVAVERFCHWQTAGFTIRKIQSRSHDDSFPEERLTQEQIALLSQNFRFLASGGSCYAFESEDGNYVLKLFKQHHLSPFSWANELPLPGNLKEKLVAKQRKRERVFNSCKMAYQDFKDKTGLIAIHLSLTDQELPTINLFDKLGIAHRLPLGKIEFILQKKAEMAYPHIVRLMNENDLEGAKRALDEIVELAAYFPKQGVRDLDPNIETNCGFIGNQAIKIDVGPLIRDEREHTAIQKRVSKASMQLKRWLNERYPELASYLDAQTSLKTKDSHESLRKRQSS